MAKRNRRVAGVDETGKAIVFKQPIPDLPDGHVRVKVEAASISPGTELNLVQQLRGGERFDNLEFPRPLGYQNAGVVDAVGKGVKQFRKGDRVTCFGGGANIADITVVPQNLCCKLPDKVSFEHGAFGNLLLTAMQAIRRGQAVLGENLLVVGMGLVGQLAAQYGRLAGMNVMGWDTLDARLRIAKKCGAHATVNVTKKDAAKEAAAFTRGDRFDMAVMALGGDATKVFEQVRGCMQQSPDGHAMGRVVVVGGCYVTFRGGAGVGNLDIRGSARTGPGYHDDAWEVGDREYPPVFMRWTTRTNMEFALRLIERGDLNLKPLITHTQPIDDFADAVELLLTRPDKAMGMVFTP